MRLLSLSYKIILSNKFGAGYHTRIMYLAPYKISGKNFCPAASDGCIKGCLYKSGMGYYSNVQASRIARSKFFIENQEEFLAQLDWEIKCLEKVCRRKKLKLAIRLNGTSDLPWENIGGIIQNNPGIQFYDYTKVRSRMMNFLDNKMPENYHLTYSMSENNLQNCLDVLEYGGNVAMVFGSTEKKEVRKFPFQFLGHQIFNGDEHDLRFLDPKNKIIGLWAKGEAKYDDTGFVLHV